MANCCPVDWNAVLPTHGCTHIQQRRIAARLDQHLHSVRLATVTCHMECSLASLQSRSAGDSRIAHAKSLRRRLGARHARACTLAWPSISTAPDCSSCFTRSASPILPRQKNNCSGHCSPATCSQRGNRRVRGPALGLTGLTHHEASNRASFPVPETG